MQTNKLVAVSMKLLQVMTGKSRTRQAYSNSKINHLIKTQLKPEIYLIPQWSSGIKIFL